LGRRALLALPIGLVLQVLLNNGGITVLGVNTCIFAIPALASRVVFYRLYIKNEKWCFAAGALSGGLGVLLTGILMMLVLQTAGEGFLLVAEYVFVLHLPVMLVEGIVTGFTVVYLQRVQPLLLRENV
jgi:cobalt/nickel transport system permease protein